MEPFPEPPDGCRAQTFSLSYPFVLPSFCPPLLSEAESWLRGTKLRTLFPFSCGILSLQCLC